VLDSFYLSNLQRWRDLATDADAELPGALAALIDDELEPLLDEDEDPIEGVHARIDRLEARVARLSNSG
jgi:hypothetical protein